MRHAIVKIATVPLLAVTSLTALSNPALASDDFVIIYQCEGGERLEVQRSDDAATVRLDDKSFELDRTRSSIGEKFESASAALIIEGPRAVFVANDRLELGACVEQTRTKAPR